MRKKDSTVLLLLASILSVVSIHLSLKIFFLIPFDVADNFGGFPKVFVSTKHLITTLVLTTSLILVSSILIKNTLKQVHGRSWGKILITYTKGVVIILIYSILSYGQTLIGSLKTDSFLQAGILLIPLYFFLVCLLFFILLREITFQMKQKNKD